MKKFITFASLAFVLAACADEQAPPPVTERTLPPKIMLNVQTISLTDRSGFEAATSLYASNSFSPTISEAIKKWADDRLQATGATGKAMVIIKEASLTSQPLQMNHGIDSWFTRQQATKYVARAEVSIEADNQINGAQTFASTNAVATRSVTLPEDPSAIEKQDAYFALLNALMKDLGQNLEAGIQSHMSDFTAAARNDTPVIAQTAPPMQPQTENPSGPVLGKSSFPTVPDLASSPGAFGIKPPQMPAPVAAPAAVPLSQPVAQ